MRPTGFITGYYCFDRASRSPELRQFRAARRNPPSSAMKNALARRVGAFFIYCCAVDSGRRGGGAAPTESPILRNVEPCTPTTPPQGLVPAPLRRWNDRMMRISYAGDQVLTGDEAAEVLLEFASQLGKRGATELVELRTIQGTGEPGVSRFLLGPASQMLISTHPSTLDQPDNSESIAFMRSELRHMNEFGKQ
jgi:hypothetical protein